MHTLVLGREARVHFCRAFNVAHTKSMMVRKSEIRASSRMRAYVCMYVCVCVGGVYLPVILLLVWILTNPRWFCFAIYVHTFGSVDRHTYIYTRTQPLQNFQSFCYYRLRTQHISLPRRLSPFGFPRRVRAGEPAARVQGSPQPDSRAGGTRRS